MRRSGSKRSLRAGSVRSLVLGDKEKYSVDGAEDQNSAFYIPVPTNGNPTEVLADRFQGMAFSVAQRSCVPFVHRNLCF